MTTLKSFPDSSGHADGCEVGSGADLGLATVGEGGDKLRRALLVGGDPAGELLQLERPRHRNLRARKRSRRDRQESTP
jgi:hypothetical protein